MFACSTASLQASPRRPGATRAESCPAEIEHRQSDFQSFAERSKNIFLRHRHVAHGKPSGRGSANADLFHPRLEHLESRHVGRDQERGDRCFVRARNRRPRHDGQNLRDRRVRDVALLAIQNVVGAVRARFRPRLDIRGVRARFFLGQREGRQLLARDERRQPFLLLLARAEKKQGPNANRMVRVCKDRGRSATRADFLEDLAVGPLGKTTTAIFLRRRHPEHSDPGEPVDHVSRNIRGPIDRHRIQILIEKFADLRERFVELGLLRGGNARIRHGPIRHEASQKQSLGEAERLRSGKKQLLRFFDFFLPLDFCFVHKVHVNRVKGASRKDGL